MALLKEFKEFALKGNVIDLAVAVVIGALFADVVKAAVDDIIMPIVGLVTPKTGWESWTVLDPVNFKLGHLLSVLIKLFIIAVVLFLIIRPIRAVMARMEPKPAPAVPTKQCPECLETVPLAAKRCKACTSALAA